LDEAKKPAFNLDKNLKLGCIDHFTSSISGKVSHKPKYDAENGLYTRTVTQIEKNHIPSWKGRARKR